MRSLAPLSEWICSDAILSQGDQIGRSITAPAPGPSAAAPAPTPSVAVVVAPAPAVKEEDGEKEEKKDGEDDKVVIKKEVEEA